MSRLQFVSAVTLGCLVSIGGWAAADETPAAPDVDQTTDAASDSFTRIRQLIEAGEHLEAAGALDLAREARAQAQTLLVQEGARLEREHEQLEELSRQLDPAPITVQVLIVEARQLPADYLAGVIRRHGGELIRPDSATDGAPAAAIFAEGSTGADEIRALADMADIKILSRPQVMALDGMLAEIQIGQQVPVVTGFTISESGTPVPMRTTEDAGISLTVTPATASAGRIRLELAVEQTRFRDDGVPVLTDPVSGEAVKSPIKDVLTAQATFTVPDGRALFFPVSHIDAAHDAGSALLLVLRPHVVTKGE